MRFKMDAITYTQARQNFTDTMNRVCDNHAPIIITRQKERPVVMMSLEDYNSIQETLYLMTSPNNHKRLLKSIEEVKRGMVNKHELDE